MNKKNKFIFNLFKLHVITHYIDFIRRYKNSIKTNLNVDEIDYKIIFKFFFSKINKEKNYEQQILFYNIRRNNNLIMRNLLFYYYTKIVILTNIIKKKLQIN